MTSGFSSSDTESLSRNIEHEYSITNLTEVWDKSRLDECTRWVNKHGFKRICLQFSDDLIPFSTNIYGDLKKILQIDVFILGDTSYGSCCVDEVAASHIDADAMIHFGHACLSKSARLPVLYIFSRFDINFAKFLHEMQTTFPDKKTNLVIFYHDGYYYRLEELRKHFQFYDNLKIAELAVDDNPKFLCWKNPEKELPDSICVYIGKENQTFFNLSITVKAKSFYCYDPNENSLKQIISPLASNWMRRRYFYVEKCKDAQSLGIVVGTLSTEGYLDVVNHIQNLARNRGIRTYLLSVGKVNPAKLANFMEIDCFAFVGCPENNIYTSREFYKPLLSIFEVELALNPAWHEKYPDFYSVDFKEILPNGDYYRNPKDIHVEEFDVSLVSGKVRSFKAMTLENGNTGSLQVEKKHNQLMESSSSTTFQERTWTGLDPTLGQQEPAKITKGRSGIAIKYTENEM